MKILAIETSCDETAAAVVENGTKVLSNVVASSTKMHEKYGGIVPEIAAREQLRSIIPAITESLQPLSHTNSTLLHRSVELHPQWMKKTIEQSIDAIAVTVGPGLIGSLLVGVETAKTLSFVTGKPIIPVNHVLAHMYTNFITQSSKVKTQNDTTIEFPAISLVVSGGHTELYLMKSMKDLTWLGGTIDDAAGECFDKTARLLGFGHGGGVAIERAALRFKVQSSKFKVKLPRPMMRDESLNFSFSGLKTAVMREWKKYPSSSRFTVHGSRLKSAFAYEIQEAITDVLVEKTLRTAKQYKAKSILLSGGVAANQRLREKFSTNLQSNELTKLSFRAPPVQLCTDNAVMIGACAYFRGSFTLSKAEGSTAWHTVTALPDLNVEAP